MIGRKKYTLPDLMQSNDEEFINNTINNYFMDILKFFNTEKQCIEIAEYYFKYNDKLLKSIKNKEGKTDNFYWGMIYASLLIPHEKDLPRYDLSSFPQDVADNYNISEQLNFSGEKLEIFANEFVYNAIAGSYYRDTNEMIYYKFYNDANLRKKSASISADIDFFLGAFVGFTEVAKAKKSNCDLYQILSRTESQKQDNNQNLYSDNYQILRKERLN